MTTKELTALEEQLGSEQVLIKKYRTMASQCTEPSIQQQLEKISQTHQKHFNTLMGYLN